MIINDIATDTQIQSIGSIMSIAQSKKLTSWSAPISLPIQMMEANDAMAKANVRIEDPMIAATRRATDRMQARMIFLTMIRLPCVLFTMTTLYRERHVLSREISGEISTGRIMPQ